jgi:cellulose synthase/poly-beta-1,6-N-acetylglucosamine synthase-like glycosyltransferase
VTGGLFIADASSLKYVDARALGGFLFIVPTGLFTAILLLTESSEWALALWRKRRVALPTAPLGSEPKISIHLPTHNEPPQMVMETLNALAKLAYKNFEVIVLDNNTKDEGDWRPVEAHCHTLGERFRFYHFDNMKGFKAGALNKALELTDPTAEYVAVIDSDYQVAPHWLHTVMPGFADPKVAIVQAPQDYRDAHESAFKQICYEEFTGFFRIGMVERNEHNAIIQHGTMCVMRKSAMVEVGGWAEWCITEDTELGLRLFEAGYKAHYTQESMGRGLMPDTYAAFKGQRYRWVYGAMQIMKRHAKEIFLGKSKLTLAQRYHFVAGWLPWFADGFALIFGVLALVWTALMAIAPRHFDVPLTVLSGVALTLFTVKTIKTIWLHRAKVGTGFIGSIASAVTGLALAYTVGKGVLLGLCTSSSPFLRTPKCEDSAPWHHALRIAKMETALLIATVAGIFATVAVTHVDDPAEMVWVIALAVMAIPQASAVMVALGSTVKIGRRTLPVLEGDLTPAPVPVLAKSDIAA